MTIETAPAALLDLALELVYAGDADTLTHALAIAEDMDRALAGFTLDWDAQVAPAALADCCKVSEWSAAGTQGIGGAR